MTWDGKHRRQTGGSTRRDSGYLVEGDDLSRKLCTRSEWAGVEAEAHMTSWYDYWAGQRRAGKNLLKDVSVMLKNPPKKSRKKEPLPVVTHVATELPSKERAFVSLMSVSALPSPSQAPKAEKESEKIM